jgi:acyl-CoA dehydrogenase family protein 9
MATLTLRDVRVARENVLGRVGGGFKVAMTVLNAGRLGSSAASVGAAKQLLALVIPYTRARRQFGRPIGEFGLIKDKLGRMAMDVFAAESMVYLTTGLIDRGVADTSVESAICKVFASETLWRVANESLAIAAGQGFVEGPPWERLMRDARAHLVFQGTNEILRCFIALSGMQGPGERLAQLADFIKWPLKGYGLAIDFVVDKLTQVVGGKVLEHADAMLKREAVYFEDSVPELAKQVEKTLRKHGKMISEMQFVQRRVADMAIDLYLMVACIARATTSIAEKGAPEAERETKLCRAACGRAATRIRRTIRQFDDNDDELLKALAKDATDAATYPFDGVL